MLVRSSVRTTVVALAALFALAAGCASTGAPARAKPSAEPTGRSVVTFAVYGPAPVVAAYKEIAARFTVAHPTTKITVLGYATHDEAMAALRQSTAEGHPPDVFLMGHDDLTSLADDKAVRRVDDLLAAREIDFGDGYTRIGLEAFSSNAALQCMPADVSPLVVYYNPKLIELDQVADPGRNPVNQENGWSLDEFARAALLARAPGVRGLYVAPDLDQVAPFIWSGGGEVVDDPQAPTTLTLSDGSSSAALVKLLELVRNPALTFNQAALQKQSALDRFKQGKLGMILGFRDLTPELRAEQNLTFDVMPLPKVGSGATIAQMSGLCISSRSKQTSQAADFLASVISDDAAETLAATGYVMPANTDVVNSDGFLQGGQRPLDANVFAREVRDTRLLPSTPRWPVVDREASRQLTQLFYEPVILPLQERLQAIDDASVSLFDPSKVAAPSPSSTP
jgi:multiple sugar transport system substrate-binding protein